MLRVSFYQASLSRVDPDRIGLAPDAFERQLSEFLIRKSQPRSFVSWRARPRERRRDAC